MSTTTTRTEKTTVARTGEKSTVQVKEVHTKQPDGSVQVERTETTKTKKPAPRTPTAKR